jgi:hypothetical protein
MKAFVELGVVSKDTQALPKPKPISDNVLEPNGVQFFKRT